MTWISPRNSNVSGRIPSSTAWAIAFPSEGGAESSKIPALASARARDAIDDPAHKAYVKNYAARWDEAPKTGSLVGYNTMLSVAAVLRKAKSTATEDLLAAMDGLMVESPSGPFQFRASDHQSTMGAWVGKTALIDGKPTMVDWRYADGAAYLPSDEEARKLRPVESE